MGRGKHPAKPAAAPAAPAKAPEAPAAPAQSSTMQSSSHAPAPAAAPQQSHAPAPQQQSHAPAPVQESSGPGIGGMLMQGAAMGAGSAVGSMAINSIFGGGSSSSSAPAQAPAPIPAGQPCSDVDSAFHKCLSNNNNNMEMCNLVFNDLQSCRKQYGIA